VRSGASAARTSAIGFWVAIWANDEERVDGKVASIGNSGTSFALQLDSIDKQLMNSVVGKDTQVKGHTASA
jgi:hypothetical protein